MILNHDVSTRLVSATLPAAEFDFADSLLGVLDQVSRAGLPARLVLRNGRGPGMAVDPVRRLCDLGGIDVDLFCVARAEDIFISFEREPNLPMARPRPWSELRWRAGYLGSAGRPAVGCTRFDVVRFTDWPTLSHLPHDEECVRVLALLTRHPTSIALARSITGVELGHLFRIYAAGLAAGLVEVINRRQPVAVAGSEPAGWRGEAERGDTPRAAPKAAGGQTSAPEEDAANEPVAGAAPAPTGRRWVSSLFARLRAL
ncbi:hypothetical protein [Derxia lacustris]|uniref:hypothetical protein n=1 Tax=Derxia lacustris TaxID=764842 RepID=UPI000A1717C1|nr:hypothetical protein [Derxia lacustris]